MVFPSPRCQTCKRRRVKCDSVRPHCGRCKKGNFSCTYDANEADGLPFRSENVFAQGRPRRPRKTKDHPVSMALTKKSSPTISPALSLPTEQHSINYWMENFIFQLNDLPDIGHEYTSYVISHWKNASPDSSLHSALLAFVNAVFGRARQVDKALQDANKLYCQTITKVNAVIKNVATEDIDQLLITTMLMSSFENIMWEFSPSNPRNSSSNSEKPGSRSWQSHRHHKGASGLLKLRQSRGLPPNLPLDRVIRRQIIRTVILRGRTIPDWLEDQQYEEEGPMRELDSLMLRLGNLRAKSMHLIRKNDSDQESPLGDPKEIAAEAQELDSSFEAWSKTVPDDWKFSTWPTPAGLESPTTALLYDCPVHLYSSHGHAAVWNRYRAIRIAVNSLHIRALGSMLPCSEQLSSISAQQKICRKNIALLANDLCGGVLFFFHAHHPLPSDGTGVRSVRIGDTIVQTDREILPKMASLIAWPLTVAVSTEAVPKLQRQWLLSRLKTVAATLEDAMLDAIIENGEFKF